MSVWNEHPEMLWIYFAFVFCSDSLNSKSEPKA